MLEVLYKIQSKALAERLSATILDIIGKLQYSFIAGGGIQEPSLLVTQLIQDAQLNQTSLQLVSFDIEKIVHNSIKSYSNTGKSPQTGFSRV